MFTKKLFINFIFLFNFINQILGTYNYFGKKLGVLNDKNIQGIVYVATKNHVYIDNLIYPKNLGCLILLCKTYYSENVDLLKKEDCFLIKDKLNKLPTFFELPNKLIISNFKTLSIFSSLKKISLKQINITENFRYPDVLKINNFELFNDFQVESIDIINLNSFYIKKLKLKNNSEIELSFLIEIKNLKQPINIKKKLLTNENDMKISLPDDLTFYNLTWISIYHKNLKFFKLNIPEIEEQSLPANIDYLQTTFINCEIILKDRLLISWEILNDELYIKLKAKINQNEYVAFGLSGSLEFNQMENADVVVVFYKNSKKKFILEDYMLTSKSKCDFKSGLGACPDKVNLNSSNDNILISSYYHSNILNLIYKRKLITGDFNGDHLIKAQEERCVIGAIGKINENNEILFHNVVTKGNDKPKKIKFGRFIQENNCLDFKINQNDIIPVSLTEKKNELNQLWKPESIKNTQKFYVKIGSSINKKSTFDISWYINDKFLPELYLKRGIEYNFFIENSNYHFYITTDPEGNGLVKYLNYLKQNKSLKNLEKIIGSLAGINFKLNDSKYEIDYLNEFNWIPDQSTPDVVYYQSFNQKNMGWKIFIHNKSRKNNTNFLVICLNWIIVFTLFKKSKI